MTAVFAGAAPALTAEHVAGAPSARSEPSTSRLRVHVEDSSDLVKRATALTQRNSATTTRIVNLGILLSRMEGLTRDEIAGMLAVKPVRLTAWVHQTQSIPSPKGDRIASLLRLTDQLHRVIERRGTARWFHLSIPELGGQSPMERICAGDLDEVAKLVESYLDPAYT